MKNNEQLTENDADPFYGLIQDYMIDLINPDFLDFDSSDS
jgi:hypothetical protein